MPVRGWIAKTAMVVVSTVMALAGLEIALRLVYLDDPLTARNFTVDPVNQQKSNIAISYDPTVGYIMRPGLRDGINSVGLMGVRANRTLAMDEELPPIPTGGVLVSGDSFTYGSEVKDYESWPAQLEARLGVPVVNAGAGGYGLDQSMLRAEQMLDVVKPRIVVISFIPEAPTRNEYSVNSGLVKPYFDIEDGALKIRNMPPPENYLPSSGHVGVFRSVFGRSYLAYWLADRFDRRGDWLVYEYEYRKENSKGIEVSCLLWQWLADRVNGRNIELVALAQYAGIHVSGFANSRDSYRVEWVLDCARSAGFVVVDSYDELRRRYEADERTFWPLWTKQAHDTERHTGHMSVEGNGVVAELLADAIRAELPASLDGAAALDTKR